MKSRPAVSESGAARTAATRFTLSPTLTRRQHVGGASISLRSLAFDLGRVVAARATLSS